MPKIRKRILAIVRWPVGGIRTYLRYVYGKLDRERYSFTIVGPDTEEMRVLFTDIAHIDPVGIFSGDESDISGFFRTAVKAILSKKCDLIHSHGATAGMCSVVPAAVMRTPHVMTLHDVFNPEQFQGLKGLVKRTAMSAGFNLADCINPVAMAAKRNLLDYFPRLQYQEEKIVSINNGIEVDRFESPETRDFRSELGITDNVFLIGFFGRFMAQKGFVYLVDAIEAIVKKSKDLPMKPLVLTFGSGGFMREDTNYIHKKGLTDYFHFLPFAPNIAPSLKGLDLVVMPSLWEASGLLAMEALVAGVPLVASTCGGLQDTIEDSPATAIGPRDSQGLATAIAQRMKNPGKAEAKAYVAQARERFDVRHTASALDEVFTRLLARKYAVASQR